MTYSVPVIAAARGEARKAMSSATSVGFAGRPNGDAAERIHQALARRLLASSGFEDQSFDEIHRCFRLNPARRHPDDTNALRADFLGQSLAVVRERRFGSRVSDGGFG